MGKRELSYEYSKFRSRFVEVDLGLVYVNFDLFKIEFIGLWMFFILRNIIVCFYYNLVGSSFKKEEEEKGEKEKDIM